MKVNLFHYIERNLLQDVNPVADVASEHERFAGQNCPQPSLMRERRQKHKSRCGNSYK